MAAFGSLRRCFFQRFALLGVARRPCSSSASASPPPPLPLQTRLLLFLDRHFDDIGIFFNWRMRQRRKRLQKTNAFYGYTQTYYGPTIRAAFFVMRINGGFRYAGQSVWFRKKQWGRYDWDFLNHGDTPLEDVDLSYTEINYTGMANLEGQRSVQTLSVRGCHFVDGWFLSRLHMFQDTLEELDISHCPRITTECLPALRHLKGLRRLDMSSLRGIKNPGLVIILLEEMLPQCEIIATGYNLSLRQGVEEGSEEQMQQQR